MVESRLLLGIVSFQSDCSSNDALYPACRDRLGAAMIMTVVK